MENKYFNQFTVFLLSVIAFSCVSGNVRTLPSALRAKAQHKFNENSEKISENVENLRTWAKNQPHLRARSDDQFLLSFIRREKYDLEEAQNRLDAFYEIRSTYPNVFKNRNILKNPRLKEIVESGTWTSMPIGNDDKPVTNIIRLGAYDPKKFTFDDFATMEALGNEILAVENDNAPISGINIVYDCTNVTEDHVSQYSVDVFNKYVLIIYDINPAEIKGCHFININPVIDHWIDTFKSTFDEEWAERIHKHPGLDSLHEFIPIENLPTEYGGPRYTLTELTNNTINLFEKYADYFDEDEQFGTDEESRSGASSVLKFPKGHKIKRN